ncbi:MAG: hypothetical protein ABUJ92_00740 [Desulfobacterales bacterium]
MPHSFALVNNYFALSTAFDIKPAIYHLLGFVVGAAFVTRPGRYPSLI